MIEAAEQIIAERGMPALTLKDVQIAADQSNKSAAKYHFGSREGLIEAVVEFRMSRVDTRRQELLAELERLDAPLTIRQAVQALIRPLAAETIGRPGSRYARFLVQAMFDPALAYLVQKHLRAETYRHTHQLMIDLCPAPSEIAAWRTDNIVMFSMTILAAREGVDSTPARTAAIVSDLVDTCVAMLEAPTSDTTVSETTTEFPGATP